MARAEWELNPAQGREKWVLFAWAYRPSGAARTASATAPSAESRSPRGELTPGARATIERTEVLGGGVCCPRGLNEADLGYIPFALLSLLT